MTITIDQMKQDLANTERDVQRLEAIVANLYAFIADSNGEDRQYLRTNLFRYEHLLREGRELAGRIRLAIDKCEKST